jgi:hypothetical protein
VFSGVYKFFLTKGEAIYCIQIKNDINGQSVWSVRHEGGSEGSSNMINKHIKFDYLNEKYQVFMVIMLFSREMIEARMMS